MFIQPAFAQAGSPMADPFAGMLIPLLLMAVIFYFLVLKPQSQRAKEHEAMVSAVRRGDTVITSGGFIGKVVRVPDNSDEIEVELNDAMKVRVLKSTLIGVRTKGEPVKDAGSQSVSK